MEKNIFCDYGGNELIRGNVEDVRHWNGKEWNRIDGKFPRGVVQLRKYWRRCGDDGKWWE